MSTRKIWQVNDTTRFTPMYPDMSQLKEKSNLYEELEKISKAEDIKQQKETDEQSRKVRERGNIYFLTKRNSTKIGMKPTASVTKLLSEKNKTKQQIKKCKAIYEEVRMLEDRYQEHLKTKTNDKISLNINTEVSKSTGYWVPVQTSTGIEYMELAKGPPILRKTDLLSDQDVLSVNNIEQMESMQNLDSHFSKINNGCRDNVKAETDTKHVTSTCETSPLDSDFINETETLDDKPKMDKKTVKSKVTSAAVSSSVYESPSTFSYSVNKDSNDIKKTETMADIPIYSDKENLDKVQHSDFHNPPLINRICFPTPQLPFFSSVVNQETFCSAVQTAKFPVGVGISSHVRRTQQFNVQQQNIRFKTTQLETMPAYNLGNFSELLGGFTSQVVSSELTLTHSFSKLEIPNSEVMDQGGNLDISNKIIVLSDSDDNDDVSLQMDSEKKKKMFTDDVSPDKEQYQPIVEDVTPTKSPYQEKSAKDISIDLAGENENIKRTIELNPGCTFLGIFPVQHPTDNSQKGALDSEKEYSFGLDKQNRSLSADKENVHSMSPNKTLFSALNEISELDHSTVSLKSDSDSCTPPKGTRTPLKAFPSP